jgi:uncharacterized membrane protein
MKWFSVDAPTGWTGVTVRAINVAVVAFVVLQAKEYVDARAFDTPATSVDAALIGAGTFLLYAILKWGKFQ